MQLVIISWKKKAWKETCLVPFRCFFIMPFYTLLQMTNKISNSNWNEKIASCKKEKEKMLTSL